MENFTLNVNNLSEDEKNMLFRLVEKANKPKNKVWKPEYGKIYYCIVNDKGIIISDWNNDTVDNNRYELGNCFKTREDAKFALERQKVITELKRFSLENNECELDWNNLKQKKYSLSFNYFSKHIHSYPNNVKSSDVYFSSKEIAEKAIETIGEDRLKKYYFEIGE